MNFPDLFLFFSCGSRLSSCVELTLLTEYRENTESCSPDLPAASGEIVRCVPSTHSPWPGRGDGSLCPERPWSHEQVSVHHSLPFVVLRLHRFIGEVLQRKCIL